MLFYIVAGSLLSLFAFAVILAGCCGDVCGLGPMNQLIFDTKKISFRSLVFINGTFFCFHSFQSLFELIK